jgi:signal transduction histidine kinase
MPDGSRAGTVAYVRDVTELRRAQREIERKNAELEHTVQAVSHDLRSPLVALLGFTRLLREDYAAVLGDDGRHYLRRIEEAGRTMEAMVHDLLELARIGRCEPRRAHVDPREVLLQLHAELKPRLDESGVSLSLPDDPPVLYCDRTQLYQVLVNLVGNAIEHMGPHEHPQVKVRIATSRDEHRLTVADNGRGIDPADHERIFELFHSQSRDRRGTGIGLAIVRKIAAAHGGRAWVESAPGRGAAFHVSLPRA